MHYELTFIISAIVPETEHPAINSEIMSQLEKIKAQIIKAPHSLGRRKLAYAIKKQKHGFYVSVEFSLEDKAGLRELDTALSHNHNILRHLVILTKPESTIKKVRRQPADRRVQLAAKEQPAKASKPKAPVKKSAPVNINLDDLDKKLDKILEEEQ